MADGAAPTHELISDGWFGEKEVMWPGQQMRLKVENVLFAEKSKFQDVLVFDSSTYGRVLVLDGVIQLTERDEFAYQEMLTHIPMFAHAVCPKNVLIVGGGDGGMLREVMKHPGVEHVTMCDIDAMVPEVSKKYLPSMSVAFSDPRLELVCEDAAVFVAADARKYDVIIVDSTDPVGPAASLYEPTFYKSMRDVLTADGVIATQGECMWLHLELIEEVMAPCAALFESVDYCYATVPTYPSGQIGFILLSMGTDVREGRREVTAEMQAQLRYYNPAIHKAAFVLPQFAEQIIAKVRKVQ